MTRKAGPRSPEDEIALFRQLTRELHEGAQAAQAAARELRAAKAEVGNWAADKATEIINPHIEELNRHVKQGETALIESYERGNELIMEKIAVLLECKTGDEMIHAIATIILNYMKEPEFIDSVAGTVLRGMAMRHPSGREPRVRVATADDLQAYLLAGGDPGLVLDLRAKT